jgi:hypothetical protein
MQSDTSGFRYHLGSYFPRRPAPVWKESGSREADDDA